MSVPSTYGPKIRLKNAYALLLNLLNFLVPLAGVSALCAVAVYGIASINDKPELDLFPTNRVMDVQITVAEEDWNKIRHQSRNFFEALQTKRKYEPIKAPYVYVTAKLTIDGVEFPEVGIRKKGFIGSQNSSRPSLKIKLNHIDEKAQAGGLTSLTFNNNNQDITLMSQFMGYAMYNAAGSPAPRCSYAKVTVNGKLIGLYSHVETIRKPLLKRSFDSARGTLYEGTVVDFFDGWEGSFEKKLGKTRMDRLSREKMKQLIEVLKRPVPDADGSAKARQQGQELEQAIGELVDLDSFYIYWAVESLLGFWDGYTANANNFFVYHNPKTDKFHFLPWGGDCMFEKRSKLPVDPRAPLSVKTKGLIAHKLYQIPAARERYARTLKEIMAKHWNEESLLAETRRIETLLKPHIPPSQAVTVRHNGIREFIRNRRGDIEKETATGMPIWAAKPSPPPLLPAFGGGRDPNADTLFKAARKDDIAAIKRHLAKKDADINQRDGSGTTALSQAVLAGKINVVRFLISRGADVTRTNRDGNSVLHGAAFLGHIEIAQLLLDSGADLNARNNRGETSLDSCAAPWSAQIQGIIQFIGGMMQIDVDMESVRNSRPKMATMLRDRGGQLGSDVAATANMDIWQAAKSGNLAALKQRLDKGSDINGLDGKGISPLAWAAMAGQPEIARLLIDRGASVNQKNKDGGTPLHGAAFLGQIELVELLIENKAEVNARNGQDETPLGTVAPKWNSGVRQVTQFFARLLQLEIDVEAIKTARPMIATILRQHGGKTSEELN